MESIIQDVEGIFCRHILGLSRSEFIRSAKEVAGDQWGFIQHGSDFENAMDWVTLEVLHEYGGFMHYTTQLISVHGVKGLTRLQHTTFQRVTPVFDDY